jgi:GTPase SAR1 family protein
LLFINFVVSRIIEPPNRLNKIWTKIVNKEIIKQGRKWTLSNGEKWLGDVDVLYNRVVYDELISQMKDKKLVLIKGTPGIGKTTFLQRLLVEIVENNQDNVPTIVLALREEGAISKYWLNSDGTIESYDIRIQGRGPQIFLSDSVDSDGISGFDLHVEVASSKESNYNNFNKQVRHHRRGLDTYMELFSFDELCEIRGNMTIDEAKFRYSIVGGSARNFIFIFPTKVDVIPFVEEVLSWFFADTNWKATFNEAFVGYCRYISQQLKDGSNVVNSLFRHNIASRDQWASKCMEIISAEITLHQEISLQAELQSLLTSSGMGDLFESLMHRKITKSGYLLTVTPLLKPNSKNVSRDNVVLRVDYPIALIENVSNIVNLTIERYGLPMYSNFPLVDAVVQPNILIQFTISPYYHKGAVDQLNSIRNGLIEKNKTKHMMIFVIPIRNKKTFKWQQDLKDIAQYISLDNEVASEQLNNTSKLAR